MSRRAPGERSPDTREGWGAAAWPWIALFGLWLWACSPMLFRTDILFTTGLRQDGGLPAAVYAGVSAAARGLRDGQAVVGFSWPCRGTAAGIAETVPTALDGWLLAPVGWLFAFPRSYAVLQAVFVLLQAVGAAALARSLGGRGAGVLLAGALGLATLPVWHEVQQGRMNGAASGIALAAVASAVALAAAVARREGRLALAGRAVLLAALGWIVLGVYPPYALLALPVGAVAVVAAGRGRRRAAGAVVALALGLGLVAATSSLLAAAAHIQDADIYDSAAACAAGDGLRCLRDDGHATLASLARILPVDGHMLGISTVALGAWVAALPALVTARLRLVAAATLVGAAALAWVGLGPCPTLDAAGPEAPGMVSLSPYGGVVEALWCRLASLHRMERPLAVAVGALAALAGAGFTRAAGRWRWPARVAGALGLAHALWLLFGVLDDGRAWQPVPDLTVSRTMETLPPSTVAVLPFDDQQQYIDAMVAPQHERLNPVVLYRPNATRPDAPFLRWLWNEGMLVDALPAPDTAAVAASGLQRVVLDLDRCAASRHAFDVPGCEQRLWTSLSEVLGPPTESDGRVHAWTLAPVGDGPTPSTCSTVELGRIERAPAASPPPPQ